jgi:hypothetical protein
LVHKQRCLSVVMSVALVFVMSMSDAFDMSLEASVLVRRVLDDALGSIGLVQRVLALDDISVAVLPLALVVVCVWVVDSVLELVRWMVMVVLAMVFGISAMMISTADVAVVSRDVAGAMSIGCGCCDED